MMAYGNGYALCVLHDGSPVREIHGKVSIPFHSEYKVRLKNKDSRMRVKARVWIDGRKVSNLGDFIIHPGETLDLERFLDCDMDTGNRFKFVPLSDSRVNDPTDSENGIIKVEFYREQGFVINWNVPIHVDPTQPWREYEVPNSGPIFGNGPTWVGGTGGANDYTRSTTTGKMKSSGITHDCCYLNNAVSPEPAGATVEGGVSNQKFVEGMDFLTDIAPTTLTLRISNTKTRERPQPNKPNRTRYCPGCGKRRQRRTDKFCTRCGGKY